MCPSPRPDPDAWRRRSPRPPGPRRAGHPKHLWITAVLVLVGLLVALGGLGALLEADRTSTPTSESATKLVDTATLPPAETTTKTTETTTKTVETRRTAETTEATKTAETPPRTPQQTASPPPEPRDTPTTTPAPKPPAPAPKPRTTTQSPAGVVVLRIIDGDTVEVRGDGRVVPDGAVAKVRLLQIDAPERGDCFADAATARTAALLPTGSTARAERDVELKDRYDRYLLYLWNEQDVFVNASLVGSGHAEAVLFPPNDKYWPTVSRAGNAAEQAGAGLWTACPGPADSTVPSPDTSEPAVPNAPTPTRPDLPPGPPAGVPDRDCSDLTGPVWVGADDPHRLDRDGDGIGCESG
ncbi:thermonuclease family protein [Streptomyces sp. DH24]|uniref:thermonuclease family protein n=1 Tax=Streptomyces sp. DH24 TaxID=3040123 RepID=UPI002442A489|nr:thermonuclease family protein [Streptomyces sp. DH24]MDG9719620.1 thermonuclease family protein [Streptomyces sp. DH24]